MEEKTANQIASLVAKSGINPELMAKLQAQMPELARNVLEIVKTQTEKELDKFVTNNVRMLELKGHVRKLAPIDHSVLIHGESGTGKELLAHALHGERKGKFIPINCACIPENLIEAELFGATKGSYTGSTSDRQGLIRAAENGTLFLDEIGDLPLHLQGRLLRFIEEGKIRALGATEEYPPGNARLNVRIVSATHKDILEMAQKDPPQFRFDLYMRISTFILKPTPLSLRKLDIKPILQHLDKEQVIEDYDAFIEPLMKSNELLKGNVRSLKQHLIRYQVLGEMPK